MTDPLTGDYLPSPTEPELAARFPSWTREQRLGYIDRVEDFYTALRAYVAEQGGD